MIDKEASSSLNGSIDHRNSLYEESIERSAEFYTKNLKERVKGPQLEGLDVAWARQSLEDPDTVTLTFENEQGREVQWPLFSKVKYNLDYNPDFFKNHYPEKDSYYLSPPPLELIEELVESGRMMSFIEENLPQGIIAYDYQEGSDNQQVIETFLLAAHQNREVRDVTPASSAYGMEYGDPIVAHFEGNVDVVNAASDEVLDMNSAFDQLVGSGKYEELPENGVTLLSSQQLESDESMLDQIWNIYNAQFNELTEDHPSLQKQPREELMRMLLDDEAVNIAAMEDGQVIGLCYFVRNISKCSWLNEEYFKQNEEEGYRTAYYPGIVVDGSKARQHFGHVQNMIGLLADLVHEANAPMKITFQCTNISKEYIPKIVTDVIKERSDQIKLANNPDENSDGSAFNEVARYNYRVAEVS